MVRDLSEEIIYNTDVAKQLIDKVGVMGLVFSHIRLNSRNSIGRHGDLVHKYHGDLVHNYVSHIRRDVL